jgi:phosphoglycerate dehydrogenase-like enzyme
VKVLVPDEVGVQVLRSVPGVEAVRYDPAVPFPEDVADAVVLVPAFHTGGTALLEQQPHLRRVQLLSAGAVAWVGRLPEGVALSDCRGAHGGATAEWVLAVLLAVYRHLPRFVTAQESGHWDYHQTEELAGKQVLLVGAGDVAEETAKRLRAIDAAPTYLARRARHGAHPDAVPPVPLQDDDAVVLGVPLTDETRGLCDERFLTAMPDGAVLVNAARGPVVDTDALLAELVSGRLRAAVDVTDPEPLPADHPLWTAPGLLLTPHVGGSVPLGRGRAYQVAAEQIACWARGEPVPNLVVDGY